MSCLLLYKDVKHSNYLKLLSVRITQTNRFRSFNLPLKPQKSILNLESVNIECKVRQLLPFLAHTNTHMMLFKT